MSHARRIIGLCTVMTLYLGPHAHARAPLVGSANGASLVNEDSIRSLEDRGPAAPRPRLVSRRPLEDGGNSRPPRERRQRGTMLPDAGPAPIDASAPATVIGEVEIRTDRQGRLLVFVDEWTDGGPPDGMVDRAFLFQSERAIQDRIDERLPLAGLVFRNTSLYVTSPGSGFVLDLAVGTDTESRTTAGRAIVLRDGLALQSRVPGSEVGVLDPGVLEHLTVVADGSGGIDAQSETCDGGGPGSMSCSYACSMSAASVTKTDECGVTCRDGYYACCTCNMVYHATCMCVKEWVSEPKTPENRIDRF